MRTQRPVKAKTRPKKGPVPETPANKVARSTRENRRCRASLARPERQTCLPAPGFAELQAQENGRPEGDYQQFREISQ